MSNPNLDDDDSYDEANATWKQKHGGTLMAGGMLLMLVLLAVFHAAC